MSSYQIVILPSDPVRHAEVLRATVEQRVAELGVPSGILRFLDEDRIASLDPKSAVVGVFFGLSENPEPTSPALTSPLDAGTVVVPVVPDTKRLDVFLPTRLRPINAMELTDEDPRLERVAAVLLENLSLLRTSRRLFISYRQAETAHIAVQLYGDLDAHGFDVFLDVHSIRPGEPFEEVLWHRLADTDVIVLLDSPDFLKSRWTVEELAQANTANIQILKIVWPDNTLEAEAAFSRPFPLEKKDFKDPTKTVGPEAMLHDDCLKRIAVETESLRARALAARYTYLVREFASKQGR